MFFAPPRSDALGHDLPARFERNAFAGVVLAALFLGVPATAWGANLINTTSFTNSSGATCIKRSFDDGSDTVECASISEVEIIDVPVPELQPLPSDQLPPIIDTNPPGPIVSDPLPLGGSPSGSIVEPSIADPVAAPSSAGGGSATNRDEQNRRRLIEANEARRKSGSRAKSRLRYDDMESPDEGTKPKRRDKNWGKLSGQIGRLGDLINKAKLGQSGDTDGEGLGGLQPEVGYGSDSPGFGGDGFEYDAGVDFESHLAATWDDAISAFGGGQSGHDYNFNPFETSVETPLDLSEQWHITGEYGLGTARPWE